MTYPELQALAHTVAARTLGPILDAMRAAHLTLAEREQCWGLIRDRQARQDAFKYPTPGRVRFERGA